MNPQPSLGDIVKYWSYTAAISNLLFTIVTSKVSQSFHLINWINRYIHQSIHPSIDTSINTSINRYPLTDVTQRGILHASSKPASERSPSVWQEANRRHACHPIAGEIHCRGRSETSHHWRPHRPGSHWRYNTPVHSLASRTSSLNSITRCDVTGWATVFPH